MRNELSTGLVGLFGALGPKDRVPREDREEPPSVILLRKQIVVRSEHILHVIRIGDHQLESRRLECANAARYCVEGLEEPIC